MPESKRNFLGGIMNKDVDERLLQPGMYRDALNIDIVHSEGDDAGTARNQKGNTKIGDLSNVSGRTVDSSTRTIGVVTSDTDNLIYYLVASDYFDGVFEFNEGSGNITRVLQSNKATPSTPSKLAFDKNYYVTGINFLDGFLFWTDDLNEPRGGNIARWKSYAIDDDLIDDDIHVIKAASLDAPTIDLLNEEDEENNMEDKFLQFSIRYKYTDDQYSAMSPFSGTSFSPDDFAIDYGAGENKAMINTKNKVNISFRTGGKHVKEIDLLARSSTGINIVIVESFNKSTLGILDDNIHDFEFSNSKIYSVIPESQLARLFDNVPIKAKAQEVISGRLLYGNYVQGYDIIDDNSEEIEIDYDIKHISKETPVDIPIQTFRSDRDYEIALNYGDKYGRVTTALTSKSNTVYIPSSKSITGNSLVLNINHVPPAFATNYRVLIKQSKTEYYSMFPVLYYVDGIYRYLLITDPEKDKVSVGSYIIFKSTGDGPTLSDLKYKVLELESKSSNFLGGTQIAGVYLKIKTDNTSFLSLASVDTLATDSKGVSVNNQGVNFCNTKWGAVPLLNAHKSIEDPIFYGESGDPLRLTIHNQQLIGDESGRYVFTFNGDSTFDCEYIETPHSSPVFIDQNIPIVSTPIDISVPSGLIPGTGGLQFRVLLNSTATYTTLDRWVVMARDSNDLGSDESVAIFPGGNDWGVGTPRVDRAIFPGAVIKIQITETFNPTNQPPIVFPPSPRLYDNIEEWFYETGAENYFVFFGHSGTQIEPLVNFKRGIDYSQVYDSVNPAQTSNGQMDNGATDTAITRAYPVRMVMKGSYASTDETGIPGLFDCDSGVLKLNFFLQQQEKPTIAETAPLEGDLDIFYETSRTYLVDNGLHKVLWDYQDFTAPAYAIISGSQFTNLGQTIPGTVPSGIEPHTFQVGDEVEVHTSNAAINGTHEILLVPDKYNIVIDLVFPGSGPVTAGSIGFYHDQIEESDQVHPTVQATLILNKVGNTNSTFNAYAFGNGLESDRIRDDFNATTLEYSPRAMIAIPDYKQERKEFSLTYSEVYRGDTSTNRLNEFNLSLSNFKILDTEFGSIQKLFDRDTNLVVFQEDKITQVLYNKNILTDTVGGGTVSSVSSVLGTQVPYKGEWGISFNPESFAQWGNDLFWTDSRRGSVLTMKSDIISNISDLGMKDHFRDLMKDTPNTQKLGVYDPEKRLYIIASNNNTSRPCSLRITLAAKDFRANPSAGATPPFGFLPDFFVFSNTSWTAEVIYGSGSGWVTGVPLSGNGSLGINYAVADNLTGSVRTATIRFTYCDGLTVDHDITQGAGSFINITAIVFSPSR